MTQDVVELDNLQAGDDVATDDVGTRRYQQIKIVDGTIDSITPAAVGGGVEANALRVTVATDSPIDTNMATVAGAVAGTEMQVDVVTSALPTGAATSANQSTANTSLSNIETAAQLIDDAIYTDDADWTDSTSKHMLTGGIYQSTMQSITDGDTGPLQVDANGQLKINGIAAEGAALGNGMLMQGDDGTDRTNVLVDTDGHLQVDVLSVTNGGTYQEDTAHTSTDYGVFTLGVRNDTLAALGGTDGDYAPFQVNASGALYTVSGANDGVDIGDVDVTSVVPGTGATNLGKAVDSPAGATDTGVPPLAIRDDALSTLTPIEGDYVPLRVNSTGALHVTGGGGGTEYSEDAATPATQVGTATMMERDDALTTITPIEGDWAGMRCSAEGALWVQDFNSDAILADTANIDTNVGTIAGAVAAGQMQVDIVADGAGLLTTAAHDAAFGTAGTADAQVRSVQGIAGGTPLEVDLGTNNDVTVTGTVTVDLGANNDVTIDGSSVVSTDDTTTHTAATTTAVNIAAVATPTDTTVEANDIAMPGMSTDRRLWTDTEVTAALPAGDNNIGNVDIASSVALDVSAATVTVDLGVNNDVTVTGGETPADADATPTDAVPVQAFNSVYNGTTWDLMREGSEAGSLLVDLGANNDVTVTGTVTVDGSGVTQPVSISDTSFAVADGNALGEGILIQGDDGTDRKNINVDATTGDVQVDVTNTVTVGSHDVTNAGTFATQVDGAALTALQLIDNPVLAHDTAVGTTQVSMAGARASNSIEGITQVANGDGTRLAADLNGVLLSRPHTTPEEHISERISNTNGTSTAFTNFAAGGAGIHNYVTDVTITNTSATDAYVDLRDGAAGSIIWTFPAPANSGATHSFSLPLKGAANTALAYDVSAAITTMYISVNGYQAQG